MILTGYLDENGTHEGSPTTVMAGIMGTARQWARFETELKALRKDYSFTVFHAKRFKAARDEFSNWSAEKYIKFLFEFGKLNTDLMEAVTCALNNDDYDQYYKGTTTPRRVRLDTKYGLTFRYCLNHFALEAMRRLGSHKKFSQTTLHIVAESGHKNAGDAERIFDEFKGELKGGGCNLLGTITFAAKDESTPLMVADYLAYGTLMRERANPARLLGERSSPVIPAQKGTGVTELKFHGEGLLSMKAELVQGLRKRGRRDATSDKIVPASGKQPC